MNEATDRLRLLSGADVRRLLPMRTCIDSMRTTLSTLAAGDAVQPLRTCTWLPDRSGLLGLMPGYLGSPDSFGLKVVTVMPGNHGTGRDSHQGFVLLFDRRHGAPVALLDASSITAIRTAAVSAVATDVLALPEAGDLALLGSGVQATSHLEALGLVRELRRVRVWSRSVENAERFARRAAEAWPDLPALEVCRTAEDAARGADLVCTLTGSREPVLEGAWLAPGAHVNVVGDAAAPSA